MKYTCTIATVLLAPWQASMAFDVSRTVIDRKTLLKHVVRATSVAVIVADDKAALAKPTITSQELKKIYDEGADTYETLYSGSLVSKALDFQTLRTNLLAKANGDVLELGVGTGLNLPLYSQDIDSGISSYTAIDLSPKMMKQAITKFKSPGGVANSLAALYSQDKVYFELGDVNELSKTLNGKKFDTIVDSFGLCVFPDPLLALQEAKKSLKPNGKLIMLEHQDSLIGKTLKPTTQIADVISTCRYDDDVIGLVKVAGFKSISKKSYAGGFLLEVVASVN